MKTLGELAREFVSIANTIEMQTVAVLLTVLGCALVLAHHADDGKLLIGGALALLQRKS
jgi:hypothetical protein